MPSIGDRLRDKGAKEPSQAKGPLWTGPNGEGPNGGISYSMISRWLTCPERFRIQVIEGLTPAPTFSAVMDYGNMWHVCEEAYAKDENSSWLSSLQLFSRRLCEKYPTQQSQIGHWYEICKAQFPLYIEHWKKFDHEGDREPLLQEAVFDVEYTLPSKRKVRLRGKWDSVDLMKDRLWLQENKTKSQIDVQKLTRQLPKDLQSMIYIISLKEKQDHSFWNRSNKRWREVPIAGVRYNVIRRSAHKSPESMIAKIQEDKKNGRIGEWFARWETRISDKDIQEFKKRTFDPILETISSWWDWVISEKGKKDPYGPYLACHYEHPLGVRNIIDEGGATDLDFYLTTGSRVGLVISDNLFPELQQ